MPKRILVACEYSGVVRSAFCNRGYDAWSCDVIDSDDGGNHIKCDVLDIIGDGWDMIIAFPPCTHLAASGAPSWPQKQADGRQLAAFTFVQSLWNADCPHICIENPTGWLNTNWKKPSQIIHPYHFGQPYMKRTCLWLNGLPKIIHTDVVEPLFHYTSNSTRGGIGKDGARKKSKLPIRKAWDTAHERSRSFEGIASAMADQWGRFITKPTYF